MTSPKRSILVTRKSELSSSAQASLIPASTIQLNVREHQAQVVQLARRFTVLLAHRRFGKTVCAVALSVIRSRQVPHMRPQVHYFAPTYKQAKKVAWAYVHEICEPLGDCKFSETELAVKLPWGAVLQLGGADDPDSWRGIYSDYAVLDEPAQMAPRFFDEIIRPALSDREGGALMIGTPAGRHGMFYESHEYGLAANDPEWISLTYKASETGIVSAKELESARRKMSQAQYDQEYECSWDAAIKGAYWAETLQRLEAAGGISDNVLHYPARPVHVVLDLGYNDATAAWFFQVDGDAVSLLTYAEYTHRSIPEIVADWRGRPYTFGKVIAPHDASNHSLQTGLTTVQQLRSLGCDVVPMDRLPINEGIESARMLMPRCRFNRTACRDGLEALRQYRADWQDQKGVLTLRPVHDWTSHGADAFRYLATFGMHKLDAYGGRLDYSGRDRARCA